MAVHLDDDDLTWPSKVWVLIWLGLMCVILVVAGIAIHNDKVQAEQKREVIIPVGSQQTIPSNVTYKFANYYDGGVVIGLENYYNFFLEGASESETFQLLENQTEINYSVNGEAYHIKVDRD